MSKSFEKYQKRRLRSSYISVIISISLVLFLLGILGLLVLNTKKVSNYFKESAAISLYLKNGIDKDKILSLQVSIDDQDFTKSTKFISKEDAAEILVKNPAVLTCGEGLRNADRAEIFRLANLRQVLDRIPPQAIWATILVLVVGIGGKILAIQLGLVDRVDWGGSVPLGF